MAYETEFVKTTAEGRHEFRLHPVSARGGPPYRAAELVDPLASA